MKTHYVQTSWLDIEFHEWNPSGSRPIVFLHGWPDSYRSWISLAPFFVRKDFRVLAPSLRGFSGTRFRDANQPRSGQPSALGRDLIEFVDALNLTEPVVVGHDWGARAVAAAVGLEPNRFLAMVMISIGYGTNYPSLEFSMHQAKLYWYHWFLGTPIGGKVLGASRLDFSRELWKSWSPEGWFSEDEFIETARSFANDDWVDVVLHYYRYRWGLVKGYSQFEGDERFLREIPKVVIPSLIIHGGCDGVNPATSSEGKEAFFQSGYQRTVLPEIGHFPQREDPTTTAQTILSFLS